MVMAETQRSPESVRSTGRLRAQQIRQDSAACVSLSSNHLSKSAQRADRRQDWFGCPYLSRRKRDDPPDLAGLPRVNPEIAAHWSHTSTWRAKGVINSNSLFLSTPPNTFTRSRCDIFCDAASLIHFFPPQCRQHCYAAMTKLAKGTVGSRAAYDGRTQAGQGN
jgi:hypothetical protein